MAWGGFGCPTSFPQLEAIMQENPYTIAVQNSHATKGRVLKMGVTGNVTLEKINENVSVNSARDDFPWVEQIEGHATKMVIVGGGPSSADHLDDIRALQEGGAIVMALNGASAWLNRNGIEPDYQFIMDARPENIELIDYGAARHFLASQCDPSLFDALDPERTMLVHLMSPGLEDHIPPQRRERGGYALIGGAGSIGNSAITLAYTRGYRDLHLFGYDTSAREGKQHAYEQPLNEGEQYVMRRLGDQAYWLTFTMAVQYQYFFQIEAALKDLGCRLKVYGDGILPERWRRLQVEMSEAEKYTEMWKFDAYRDFSPGEQLVDRIDAWLPARSAVIDFGCGTGRAALGLKKRDHDVLLVDIADNCRDPEAMDLPFRQHDMSRPLPLGFAYDHGICCDVMEHIPPDQVHAVLANIADACRNVFFRIEFGPDHFGPIVLGRDLHLSVHDQEWWAKKLREFWPHVEAQDGGVFLVSKETENAQH